MPALEQLSDQSLMRRDAETDPFHFLSMCLNASKESLLEDLSSESFSFEEPAYESRPTASRVFQQSKGNHELNARPHYLPVVSRGDVRSAKRNMRLALEKSQPFSSSASIRRNEDDLSFVFMSHPAEDATLSTSSQGSSSLQESVCNISATHRELKTLEYYTPRIISNKNCLSARNRDPAAFVCCECSRSAPLQPTYNPCHNTTRTDVPHELLVSSSAHLSETEATTPTPSYLSPLSSSHGSIPASSPVSLSLPSLENSLDLPSFDFSPSKLQNNVHEESSSCSVLRHGGGSATEQHYRADLTTTYSISVSESTEEAESLSLSSVSYALEEQQHVDQICSSTDLMRRSMLDLVRNQQSTDKSFAQGIEDELHNMPKIKESGIDMKDMTWKEYSQVKVNLLLKQLLNSAYVSICSTMSYELWTAWIVLYMNISSSFSPRKGLFMIVAMLGIAMSLLWLLAITNQDTKRTFQFSATSCWDGFIQANAAHSDFDSMNHLNEQREFHFPSHMDMFDRL